jgi:hypothetical protein
VSIAAEEALKNLGYLLRCSLSQPTKEAEISAAHRQGRRRASRPCRGCPRGTSWWCPWVRLCACRRPRTMWRRCCPPPHACARRSTSLHHINSNKCYCFITITKLHSFLSKRHGASADKAACEGYQNAAPCWLARSEQGPVNRGHCAQYLQPPPPAGATSPYPN